MSNKFKRRAELVGLYINDTKKAEAVGPSGWAIGIGPAPKMIAIARKNDFLEGRRAEFRIDLIEDLPFEGNNFDCVLSSLMIHHLPPDLKVKGLAEVYRLLKPGARLLVADIDKPVKQLWWLLRWPLCLWFFTRNHVNGKLPIYFAEAGFNPVTKLGHWRGLLSFWLAYKPQR